MKNKHFVSYASGDYNLSNFNTILYLRICILSFFTETPVLVFVFHSSFDVGCSMFDVHLLICSMFIFFSKHWGSDVPWLNSLRTFSAKNLTGQAGFRGSGLWGLGFKVPSTLNLETFEP
jgi:hypothetical protein